MCDRRCANASPNSSRLAGAAMSLTADWMFGLLGPFDDPVLLLIARSDSAGDTGAIGPWTHLTAPSCGARADSGAPCSPPSGTFSGLRYFARLAEDLRFEIVKGRPGRHLVPVIERMLAHVCE